MKIGIIGAGKVGIAIASVLKSRGFEIAGIASRRQESLDVARRYVGEGPIYAIDVGPIVEGSDVVGVTTQDREISTVAGEISRRFSDLKGKIFFHVSGAQEASELKPLDGKGALLGSLHPLQTFPDIGSGIAVLPSTYIFIEGDKGAMPNLQRIAGSIGFKSLQIAGRHKVLYHLSAVFACNLLSALMYEGERVMDRIGIDLVPFFPIIEATLRNIETKGPLHSLTGPIVRGDAETVVSHLSAIEDMPLAVRVYKELSRVALEMAQKRGVLSGEQIIALEGVLSEQDRKTTK